MPSASRTVDKKQETLNNKQETLNIKKVFQVSSFKFQVSNKGFTLIELLVVITLFGITSILITASYLTFDRNQRIRSAAQTLKNDLRFVQNKSLAGDKGANSECPIASTLIGWYLTFNTSQTSTYTYAGACNTSGTEASFNSKTVSFPSGVTINTNGIKIGANPQTGIVTVLFKPLVTDVALHSSSVPPFNSGNTISFSGDLTIELKGQQTLNLNMVTVRTTGEISGN